MGAEGSIAHPTALVVEHCHGGRSLWSGTIKAVALGAIHHNLVAFHLVERGTVEGGLTVLVSAALNGGAELRAVAHMLLLAGGEGE